MMCSDGSRGCIPASAAIHRYALHMLPTPMQMLGSSLNRALSPLTARVRAIVAVHNATTGADSPASAVGLSIVGDVGIGLANAIRPTTTSIHCNQIIVMSRNFNARTLPFRSKRLVLNRGRGSDHMHKAIVELKSHSGTDGLLRLQGTSQYTQIGAHTGLGVLRSLSVLPVELHPCSHPGNSQNCRHQNPSISPFLTWTRSSTPIGAKEPSHRKR